MSKSQLAFQPRFRIFEIQKAIAMDSKRKNIAKEPSEEYETHPGLIKVLEKSIQDAKEGKGISHGEMQKRIKEKFSFLK